MSYLVLSTSSWLTPWLFRKKQNVEIAKRSEGHQELVARNDEISNAIRELSNLTVSTQGEQTQQIAKMLMALREAIVTRLEDNPASTRENPPPYEKNESESKQKALELIEGHHTDEMMSLLDEQPMIAVQPLDRSKRTACHVAASMGNLELLKTLIHSSSDINAQDKTGRTPLHLAVQNDHARCVRYLLFSHAEPDRRDDAMKTPINYAAGASEISFMLNNGWDIESKNAAGKTALLFFIERQRPGIVQSLLEQGAKKDYRGPVNEGATPLTMAADQGYIRIVSLLLDHGADVNYQSDRKDTALTNAARQGHMAVVRKLLEYNADIDITNKIGFDAGMEAVYHAHDAVAVLLIERGISLSNVSRDSRTMIQMAGENGTPRTLEAILKRNPKLIHVRNNHGFTALHESCSHGHEACVEICLRYGARTEIRTENNEGLSPLHLAAGKGHPPIIRRLVESGADIEARCSAMLTPLYTAVFRQRVYAVRELLSLGANANAQELVKALWTCLYKAVHSGNREIVRLLIQEGGADVNLQNSFGLDRTPLMEAVVSNNFTMASDLIKLYKADPNIRDCNPRIAKGREYTPLAQAAMDAHRNGIDMVRLLVEDGKADLEIANAKHHWTPLHEVACHGPVAAVRLLLENGANRHAVGICDFTGVPMTPVQLAEREMKHKNQWRNIVDVLKNEYLSEDDYVDVKPEKKSRK